MASQYLRQMEYNQAQTVPDKTLLYIDANKRSLHLSPTAVTDLKVPTERNYRDTKLLLLQFALPHMLHCPYCRLATNMFYISGKSCITYFC